MAGYGSLVHVADDEEGYLLGRIAHLGADTLSVDLLPPGHGSVSLPRDSVLPAEEDQRKDVDDNCALINLNEATLLHNCRLRYNQKQIYTYVANILISVNPYENVPDLYSLDMIRRYQGQSLGTLPPHVFAIADKAFRDMKRLLESQSVIVHGESGAGKTETLKCIQRYLCECWDSSTGPVEQRLLDSNTIMEAFGNAKTNRNNNSSRFGKFVEIHFGQERQVAGGFVSHYLLETSRLCHQQAGERNYHIFYQLLAGADAQTAHRLRLAPADQFNYLRNGTTQFFASASSASHIPADRKANKDNINDAMVDDYADFKRLCKALREIGMDNSLLDGLFRTIAAILHLGNVEFMENANDSRGGCTVKPCTIPSLEIAAGLLGLDYTELRRRLTTRLMQPTKTGVGSTMIKIPLKIHEANTTRDALSKTIYSRLFDNVVTSINRCITSSDSANYIGVLDFAGFEFFAVNSFEQFCNNYCDEKLQQFFVDRILTKEQYLYKKERLNMAWIEYTNNKGCIELFEEHTYGLLDMLDEEARSPCPSPQHFTAGVHQRHQKHFWLTEPRQSSVQEHREMRKEQGFIIRHYAGAACYQTSLFLEKNSDALHVSLESLMEKTKNDFTKKLFEGHDNANGAPATNGNSQQQNTIYESVSRKLRTQMGLLLRKLESTGTHFVRCIKPNSTMAPGQLKGADVLRQLKCAGMTSALKLMQKGYPSSTFFADFYTPHRAVLPPELANVNRILFCKCLFHAVGLNDADYKFGLTKIFFRSGMFAKFDQLVGLDQRSITTLFPNMMSYLDRALRSADDLEDLSSGMAIREAPALTQRPSSDGNAVTTIQDEAASEHQQAASDMRSPKETPAPGSLPQNVYTGTHQNSSTGSAVVKTKASQTNRLVANWHAFFATIETAIPTLISGVDRQVLCKRVLYTMGFDDRDFHFNEAKLIFHQRNKFDEFNRRRERQNARMLARRLSVWTTPTRSYLLKTWDHDLKAKKEERRNWTAVYVGNAEPLTDQQLRDHFTKYGGVAKVERKQLDSKYGQAKYGVAFVFFTNAEGAQRALEEPSPVVGFRTLTVGKAKSDANSFSGNAGPTSSTDNATRCLLPKSKEDFRIFGTFDDHEGFLYTLNNVAFGRVGDVATADYIDNCDHIPESVGDEHGVIDGLIAMEKEEGLVFQAEASNDWEAARLHRASHITILSAIDMYCLSVPLQELPMVDRVLWVPTAPAKKMRYEDIKKKFAGHIHDVLFQRRGQPCFSASVGYYVIFKTAEEAQKVYSTLDGYLAYRPAEGDWWHHLFRLFFTRRMIEIRSKLFGAGLCARAWRHSKFWGDREYARARHVEATQESTDDATSAATISSVNAVDQPLALDHSATVDAFVSLPSMENTCESSPLSSSSGNAAISTTATSPAPVSEEELSDLREQQRQFRQEYHLSYASASQQQEQHVTDSYAAHVAEMASRRVPQNLTTTDITVATAGVLRRLSYALYQFFGDKSFLTDPNYKYMPNDRFKKALKPCQGVSYGYVIDECDALYERNPSRNKPVIEYLLNCVDHWYDTATMLNLGGLTLRDIFWLDYDDPRRQDDGVVRGDGADKALMLPPDFPLRRVNTTGEMQELVVHLNSLNSKDAIALDTDGVPCETMQISTTRNGAFVMDMRDCRKHPAVLAQVGDAIVRSQCLRFGQSWGPEDQRGLRQMTSPTTGNAVVHDIREFVLRVFGMTAAAANAPSLGSVVHMVTGLYLPKDCQVSNWHERPRCRKFGLTARQYRYAVMDAVAIIIMLRLMQQKFPNRFGSVWADFMRMASGTKFSLEHFHNCGGSVPGLYEEDDQ